VASLSATYLSQLQRGVGEHWSGPAELVDLLAGLLEPGHSARVLDVGCGIGGPARRLSDLRRCRIVAFDVVEDLASAARALASETARISFLAADADHLPFAASSFDQVWALGVLAHTRIVRSAEEARRVLVDGGTLGAVEVLRRGRASPRFAGSAPRPWTPYTSIDVSEALDRAGFSRVDVSVSDALRDPDPLDEGLRRDLADGRLAPHLIVARVA
jgi:ubiquinone/menaquinone biosynthesis C-methylase UbiE